MKKKPVDPTPFHERIFMHQASAYLPGQPTYDQIEKWMKRGKAAPDGAVVVLRSFIGSSRLRYTTQQWIAEFVGHDFVEPLAKAFATMPPAVTTDAAPAPALAESTANNGGPMTECTLTPSPVTAPEPVYLTCAQVAPLCPGMPSETSVRNWVTLGIKVRSSGTRMYLKHIRVGGRILTTKEWAMAFCEELGRANQIAPAPKEKYTPPTRVRSEAKRLKAIAEARLELANS